MKRPNPLSPSPLDFDSSDVPISVLVRQLPATDLARVLDAAVHERRDPETRRHLAHAIRAERACPGAPIAHVACEWAYKAALRAFVRVVR